MRVQTSIHNTVLFWDEKEATILILIPTYILHQIDKESYIRIQISVAHGKHTNYFAHAQRYLL